MLENNHGIRRILMDGAIYEFIQRALGANRVRRWLKILWNQAKPASVLDIGCGPGVIRKFFSSEVNYVGFDPSHHYINKARNNSLQNTQYFQGVSRDFLSRLLTKSKKFPF